MRWLRTGLLVRRGPAQKVGRGGGLLWSERDLREAQIAAALRDYVSRAEGPLGEIMHAVQKHEALPADPALRLDAEGKPSIVEYDSELDDLKLIASQEVRRSWIRRRTPRQRWLEQHEIQELERGQVAQMVLDLCDP